MLNHQVAERLAVDQDYALRKMSHEFARTSTKRRCRNKNTFCRTKADEAANETLHIRSSNACSRRIPFSLNVDTVQTKSIFVNHTIYATVAGAT